MQLTYIVANTKGGVGKTTLAVALHGLLERRGLSFSCVDADGRNKLRSIIGDGVTALQAGATAEELRENPDVAYRYWDKIGQAMMAGNALVDLGANVDSHVWAWAGKANLAKYLNQKSVLVRVLVPTTAEPASVAGAIDTLTAVGTVFPSADRTLVLNGAAGGFEAYENTPELESLKAMQAEGQLKIVEMPRCHSGIWRDFEKALISPWRAVEMPPEAVADVLGLAATPWVADEGLGDLASWLRRLERELDHVLPPFPAKTKKPAAA